jgi:hypothetical protein
MVKAYITKNKMNKWIFAVNDVEENDFNELTRKIWMKIFNCGEKIF